MSTSTMTRFILAPPSVRALTLYSHNILPLFSVREFTSPRRYATQSITQLSFWKNLIPKPLRKSAIPSTPTNPRHNSREWNPATFFIIIFLLIGSMSIQMIALRNEFALFSRRADAKIGLLKEIVQRVQRGEKVDVEGLLGTGDKEKEKEWEEVLKEIEEEDEAWELLHRKKPKHGKNLDTTKDKSMSVDTATQASSSSPKKEDTPTGFY